MFWGVLPAIQTPIGVLPSLLILEVLSFFLIKLFSIYRGRNGGQKSAVGSLGQENVGFRLFWPASKPAVWAVD